MNQEGYTDYDFLWLISKIGVLKLKYCHNKEAVKAIEEAINMLEEFKNKQT